LDILWNLIINKLNKMNKIISKTLKLENIITIVGSIVFIPLWLIVMYEGLIKGGFHILDTLIINS
tara:strand:+ start:34 stop:228 length:195 start_codon:yes stop_codon:yes gene_type:complete